MSCPDRELRQVLPQDLHEHWPLVKQGLEKIRTHELKEDWISEDVYSAIRAGTSTLHMAYVGSEYAGFCVLSLLQGYKSKALHIWVAYGLNGMDIVERFEPEVVKIGLSSGVKKITFLSPRRGWEKKLSDYTAVHTVFEKEL